MAYPLVWPALGVEISADRSRTWVARASWDGARSVLVELLDPIVGSATAPAVIAEWRAQWQVSVVVLDPRSPSATLVEALAPVRLVDARGMAAAHGRFVDVLGDGRLRVRGHSALDAAARLAQDRRLAGAAAVDRYGPATDQAPLVAAELAVWAAEGLDYDLMASFG